MYLFFLKQNADGGYAPPQKCDFRAVPEGMAVWPEELGQEDFIACSGFVTPTVEDIDGVPTVTGYTPNVEAWEAWKASLPPAAAPAPDAQADIDAMLVDHEYRLTLLELGLWEGGEV